MIPNSVGQQQNSVFLGDDGLIEVHVVGQQSTESVHAMGDQIRPLTRVLRQHGKPVLILDDLINMPPKQSREVGSAVAQEARLIDFDRVAMVGPDNPLLKYGVQFVIAAIGMGKKIKYFTDRPSALDWLRL